MKIFLSPHNDDETLFGAFTLMREKPLVVIVTDSWIQFKRGHAEASAEKRWAETCKAMDILGCPVARLGIRDDEITDYLVERALRRIHGVELVYAPAMQGGHIHHDIVGGVAKRVFGAENVVQYCTYSESKPHYANEGQIRVDGTAEEWDFKKAALVQYTSQLKLAWPHFVAVNGQPEWLS